MNKTFHYLAINWSILVLAVILTYIFPAAFVFTFFIISNRQFANYLVGHDGIHGSICRSRRLNQLIAKYFCLYPVVVSFGDYQTNHMAHHRFLGTTVDPDAQLYSFYPTTQRKLVLHLLIRFFSGQMIVDFLRYFTPAHRLFKSGARRAILESDTVEYVFAVIVAASALFFLGGPWLMVIWFAPIILVIPYYYFVSALQHGAIFNLPPPKNSRNINGNWLLMELLLPCGTHLHGVHHDHPAVPFHMLERNLSSSAGVQTLRESLGDLFVGSQ